MTAALHLSRDSLRSSDSRKTGVSGFKELYLKAELSPEEAFQPLLFVCTSRHDPLDFFEEFKDMSWPSKNQFFGDLLNGSLLTNDEVGTMASGCNCYLEILKSNLILSDEEGIRFHNIENREKPSGGKKLRAKTTITVPQVFLLFDAVNRLEGRF